MKAGGENACYSAAIIIASGAESKSIKYGPKENASGVSARWILSPGEPASPFPAPNRYHPSRPGPPPHVTSGPAPERLGPPLTQPTPSSCPPSNPNSSQPAPELTRPLAAPAPDAPTWIGNPPRFNLIFSAPPKPTRPLDGVEKPQRVDLERRQRSGCLRRRCAGQHLVEVLLDGVDLPWTPYFPPRVSQKGRDLVW